MAKGQLEYDDSAFYYFMLSLLSLYLVRALFTGRGDVYTTPGSKPGVNSFAARGDPSTCPG